LKSGKINVNYLGEKPVRYTIDAVPTGPIIKNYTDGGSLRQYVFVFASREYYDQDVLENMETARFYENFAAWIEEQDDKKKLPKVVQGMHAVAVQVLTNGYAYNVDTGYARFQIQCRLIYKKER